jgi:hypothetical protein
MSYTKPWRVGEPGCVIFILDQSGRTAERHGLPLRWMDLVANLANETIRKLADASRKGFEIRPRVEIAILGYGSGVRSSLPPALAGRDLATITELFAHTIRVETKTIPVYHKELGETEMREVEFRVWVEPNSEGGRSSCQALRCAASLAHSWTSNHSTSYPPPLCYSCHQRRLPN